MSLERLFQLSASNITQIMGTAQDFTTDNTVSWRRYLFHIIFY